MLGIGLWSPQTEKRGRGGGEMGHLLLVSPFLIMGPHSSLSSFLLFPPSTSGNRKFHQNVYGISPSHPLAPLLPESSPHPHPLASVPNPTRCFCLRLCSAPSAQTSACRVKSRFLAQGPRPARPSLCWVLWLLPRALSLPGFTLQLKGHHITSGHASQRAHPRVPLSP